MRIRICFLHGPVEGVQPVVAYHVMTLDTKISIEFAVLHVTDKGFYCEDFGRWICPAAILAVEIE